MENKNSKHEMDEYKGYKTRYKNLDFNSWASLENILAVSFIKLNMQMA